MAANIESIVERLAEAPIPEAWVAFRGERALEAHLRGLERASWRAIGGSREGRPIYGVQFGRGPRRAAIIAGCHADEPVGPMTAQALPLLIEAWAPGLLDAWQFRLVPQMNPDGAARNRAWFRRPLDFTAYMRHAVREAPGDDLEFGFGSDPALLRPECRAVKAWLAEGAPYALHASLHGMPYAEGAWFLIGRAWAARAAPLMDAAERLCAHIEFPLHDIDRRGEKGFHRLRKGFATTPTAAAMRDFFTARGEPETAARFQPASMELARGFGGDPLCIVPEIPLFRIGPPGNSPAACPYGPFHAKLSAARADELDEAAVAAVAAAHQLEPVPLPLQLRLTASFVLLALHALG